MNIMKKTLSIALLGILFFIAMKPSSGLPFNADDSESNLDYTTETLPYEDIQPINDQSVNDTEETFQRIARDLSSDQQRFRQEMLQAHNQYRARHCVPRLTLDTNLNNGAQQYAEYLIRTNRFQHSGAAGLGENLASMSSSVRITNYSGRQPTDQWYREVSQYNYNQGGFSMATGHFTQVVWKSSQRLGVGVAYNSAGTRVVVVARYSPPGNYANQYQANVLRPC